MDSIIKKLREEKGLSQKELGSMIGKNENYINGLEENIEEVDPNIRILRKLAEAFNVNLLDLFCCICKECNFDNCKDCSVE